MTTKTVTPTIRINPDDLTAMTALVTERASTLLKLQTLSSNILANGIPEVGKKDSIKMYIEINGSTVMDSTIAVPAHPIGLQMRSTFIEMLAAVTKSIDLQLSKYGVSVDDTQAFVDADAAIASHTNALMSFFNPITEDTPVPEAEELPEVLAA